MSDIELKTIVEIGAGIATIVSLLFVSYQYVKEKTNFNKKIYFQDMNPRVPKGFLLNPKDTQYSIDKALLKYDFSLFNETKKSIKVNEIIVYFLYKNKPFSTLLLKSHFEPNIIRPNEEFTFNLSGNYPDILHKLYKNRDLNYVFKIVLMVSYFYGNDYYTVYIPLGITNFITKPDFEKKYLESNEYIYLLSTNIYNQEYFNIHQFKNRIRHYQLYLGYKIGLHPKVSKKSKFIGKLLDFVSNEFDIKHKDLYENALKRSENITIELLEKQIGNN